MINFRVRMLAATVSVSLALTGCTENSGSPGATPTPAVDLRAIEDVAPYWCSDLVPREGLSRASGFRGNITENDMMRLRSSNDGTCLVQQKIEYPLHLYIDKGNEAKSRMDNIKGAVDSDSQKPEALDMGVGIGRVRPVSDPPSEVGYSAWTLFGCDEESIVFVFAVHVVENYKGRNMVKDASALLSIAQKRYAELMKCELGPPPDKELIPS